MSLANAHGKLATVLEALEESNVDVEDAAVLGQDPEEDVVLVDVTLFVPLDQEVDLSATAGSDPSSVYPDEVRDVDTCETIDEEVEDAVDEVEEDEDSLEESSDEQEDTADDTRDADPKQQIVDALAEDGSLSSDELLDRVSVERRILYNHLRDLREAGRVESREHPEDARKSLYVLVDEASESDDETDDEDGSKETDDEPDHRIGDELEDDVVDDNDQEASADGGAVATDADDDVVDLPGDATAADVHDLIEALGPKPYLGELADELDIERDRARTIVHKLDRYGDVIDAPQYKGGGD